MNSPRLFAVLSVLPAAFAGASAIPEPFPAGRYEKLLADSPFVLATPAKPVEADTGPSWSANLYLGSVWRTEIDGEETPCATIKSRADISGSFTLIGHQPGPDGIELVSINWNDDIYKTVAMVKKGTEVVPIKPSEQPPPNAPPQVQPQPPRPNGVAGALGATAINNPLRRPAQPVVPRPVQPTITPAGVPRPTNAPAPAPNPGLPAGNAQNNDRGRVRVINNR